MPLSLRTLEDLREEAMAEDVSLLQVSRTLEHLYSVNL